MLRYKTKLVKTVISNNSVIIHLQMTYNLSYFIGSVVYCTSMNNYIDKTSRYKMVHTFTYTYAFYYMITNIKFNGIDSLVAWFGHALT